VWRIVAVPHSRPNNFSTPSFTHHPHPRHCPLLKVSFPASLDRQERQTHVRGSSEICDADYELICSSKWDKVLTYCTRSRLACDKSADFEGRRRPNSRVADHRVTTLAAETKVVSLEVTCSGVSSCSSVSIKIRSRCVTAGQMDQRKQVMSTHRRSHQTRDDRASRGTCCWCRTAG
jgi:hypothetical protein